MLTLRSSPASPFGRKVKIAAALCGLSDRITILETDTVKPDAAFTRQNPLGKIPTLVLENGDALYDSRVIVDYLDHLAGGGRIIPPGEGRFPALRMMALADGIADAALLVVYESRFRQEGERSAWWLAHQRGKIDRGLAVLEAEDLDAGADHVGAIALACALGYLDLRFEGRWRAGHPRLAAWLAAFADRVPAFEATRMKPA